MTTAHSVISENTSFLIISAIELAFDLFLNKFITLEGESFVTVRFCLNPLRGT